MPLKDVRDVINSAVNRIVLYPSSELTMGKNKTNTYHRVFRLLHLNTQIQDRWVKRSINGWCSHAQYHHRIIKVGKDL